MAKKRKINWENPFIILEESDEDLAYRLLDMAKTGETPGRAIALQQAARRLFLKTWIKETKCT
jgi:hypothetical protein